MSTATQASVAGSITAKSANAVDVVDIVLSAVAQKKASAIWFEPMANAPDGGSHRLTIDKGKHSLVSAELHRGLGDAVLARFALLARLDLLAPGVQNGRVKARVDESEIDMLVTIRFTDSGLSGELRVLNEVGGELDTSVTAPAEGQDYPDVLPPGTSVGPYRVVCVLGQGGMGMVYCVEHTLLRKEFAMKVMLKDVHDGDRDAARRFVREARAAARVQHDSIVDVSDFGSFPDGRHYLVMQLLSGNSLEDIMDRRGAIEPLRAIALMREAASALAAAHSAGIVHRDVSPSNIFVDKVEGVERVKVVDFGAASIPDADQQDVPDGPPGMVVGTPYYMAPEQAQALPTDARSDMYSFGVVLYELLSGRVPFEGETARDIVMQHILEEPPPLWTPEGGDVPEEVWLVVQKLMAKKPEDRYSTTDAVIVELDRMTALLQRKGWRRWLPA